MPIIEVNHVTKEFQLGQLHSLKQTALNGLRRLAGQPVEERQPFKALDDVSFSVEEGEVLGIIGHNGAGKSTLLKLLANISQPTHGSIKVRGRVAPLIEVGAGLIGDLTGRENIFLNGALLGMSRQEIKRKFDDIVAFAELEDFIDTPIKRYSSGMQVRLGFSIATSVESGILIVDEVLAVGDLAFQRKCFDRMEDLIAHQGRTVLVVSHNIRQIQRLCAKTILLDRGKIMCMDSSKQVCDMFYAISDQKIAASGATSRTPVLQKTDEIDIEDIFLTDANGNRTTTLEYDKPASIHIKATAHQPLLDVTIGFGFHTSDFLYLTTHNSEDQLRIPSLAQGRHEFVCKIRSPILLPGNFGIRVGITSGKALRTMFYGENLLHFNVAGSVSPNIRDGLFALDAKWEIQPQGITISTQEQIASAPHL